MWVGEAGEKSSLLRGKRGKEGREGGGKKEVKVQNEEGDSNSIKKPIVHYCENQLLLSLFSARL